jgi:nitroimidazol reductase NimA-like FMN-containing flavoprotein (pyridoxamine 5'-phosphate oxidase superfamily)
MNPEDPMTLKCRSGTSWRTAFLYGKAVIITHNSKRMAALLQ